MFKTPSGKTLVTLIPGDGIGPECTNSARQIIEATGAPIEWEIRHAGESVFKQNIASGVPTDTIESVRKTRLVFKGPLGTPIGYGEKSANVTLRKLFETYGNLRPVRELPGIKTPYSGRGVDLIVVRENVEDLYAGIEHMQTPGVAQCLKLISRKGCEKIVRLGFEVARAEGRKSVACATKSNIMKMTEGMMKRTFEEVAKEYPDIQSWHVIIDNCAHQLVKKPEQFDVIVTTNMNGDIISDLTSALIGGLGFAPSANIGNEVAIFEAVHGSAPKYAGKNCINPTAVILTGVLMLRHMGMFEEAQKIEHAVLVTLEENARAGRGTGDVAGYGTPAAVSTSEYTEQIIRNLGKRSEKWKVRDYKSVKLPQVSSAQDTVKAKTRRVVGIDLFVESAIHPEQLGPQIESLLTPTPLKLKTIANRGTKVYPAGGAITDCTDAHIARLMLKDAGGDLGDATVLDVLQRLSGKIHWGHVEKLSEFDGAASYTKAQGED
ncbi:MAG: NADP-dependent isocitrate dehydrogenase [Phycisphaerae bacterium]